MSDFGEKLIELRKKSKLSLKKISEQVGIPPSRLVELENGVRIPTTGQIEHLGTFYGADAEELAHLSQQPEKANW